MRCAPDKNAECTNECLFGERVALIEPTPDSLTGRKLQTSFAQENTPDSGQWLQVRAERDNYVGFIQRTHLQAVDSITPLATHRVANRSTLVFSQPSIKSQILNRLPFLSHIIATNEQILPFLRLTTGGFVWSQHLMETGSTVQSTAVELAESHFLGAPYLWGGCTPEGLDCSGLIQALATAKGLSIPRDSDDQEKALTHTIMQGQQQAQDIVYWPGHTGILVDAETVLHATAHSLSCVVEPLDEVVNRAGNISSIKRLFTG